MRKCVHVQKPGAEVNKTKQMDTWKLDSYATESILSVFVLDVHEGKNWFPFFSQKKSNKVHVLCRSKKKKKTAKQTYKSNNFLLKRNHHKCQIIKTVSVLLVKRSANKIQNIRILIKLFFHADNKPHYCVFKKERKANYTAALELEVVHQPLHRVCRMNHY